MASGRILLKHHRTSFLPLQPFLSDSLQSTIPLLTLKNPFILSSTMFRSAIVRSLRASVPRAVRSPAASSLRIRSSPVAVRPSQQLPSCFTSQALRFYSAPAGLGKDEVEGRIVNLLKNFDKVRWTCFAIIPRGPGRGLM